MKRFLNWLFPSPGPWMYKHCTDNLSTTPSKGTPAGTPWPLEDIDD